MDLINVNNISFTYPRTGLMFNAAIDNVSFSVKRGETLGILGRTGSGKSTLLQTLNGLIRPKSGFVFLNGRDIWENPKKISQNRFKVGLVFQYPEYQLFEETVYRDIAYGPKNMGLDEKEVDRRVNRCSSLLGLDNRLLQKSPFDLSGGEKKRAALAGIMAMEPEVLVLDEPTAGLDPQGRKMLFKAISEYQKDLNAAIIVVSHSMEDLASVCDKLFVMNNGQSVMFGTVSEIFSKGDKLREIGLDVPMVTKVLDKLKEDGLIESCDAYTLESAFNLIVSALKQRGDKNA